MASDTAAANNLPAFIWDEALIRRYDLSGPRYTSYPTAVEFTPNYSIEDMVKAAGRSKAAGAAACCTMPKVPPPSIILMRRGG